MKNDRFNELIRFSEKSRKLGVSLEEFIIMFLGLSPEHRVEGKTRFQKLIYILNTYYDLFDNLSFFRYYYGPFSTELDDTLNNLKLLGYIDEEVIYFGVDHFNFQVNISLTELGIKKFRELKLKYQVPFDRIKDMINSLLKTDTYDYYTMELQKFLNIVYNIAGYK